MVVECSKLSLSDRPQTPDRVYKVIVIGNSSTGKTSIIRRYMNNTFVPQTQATIDISYAIKTVTLYKTLKK